jgi:hypothetical protein
MSLEVIKEMNDVSAYARTQCEITFRPRVYSRSYILLCENITTECPQCNSNITFNNYDQISYCNECYKYSIEQYLSKVVKYIDNYDLDITDEKDFEYYSVDGTMYKHNILDNEKIYYCVTFCGASYECNEWSSSPHDDFYYYTAIFINEDTRNAKYDDKDFVSHAFRECG